MQAGFTVLIVALSLGQPGPDDRAAIDQRVARRIDFAPKLQLMEGDTVFIERRELVIAKRVPRKASEYEGVVTGITAPKGVVVHARVDEVVIDQLGDKTAVSFRYAIHVDPGTTKGGAVRMTLNLVERTGLANTVTQAKLFFTVSIVPARATPAELASDFWGYRLYRKEAEAKIGALARKGLELSIADQGRLPSLSRVSSEVALDVYTFERARRRAWVAHRHLIAARTSSDPKIASAAKTYLDNLERADDQLSGLPAIASTGSGRSGDDDVVTLKPERVEPADSGRGSGGGGGGGGGGGDTLAPVTSYEPGSEGDDDVSEPAREEIPKKDPAEKPIEVAKADPNAQPGDPAIGGGQAQPDNLQSSEDEFLEGRSRRNEVLIPSYPRALLLDDPNIAFGGGVRFTWASVNVEGTSGTVPAWFYYAQAAITRAMGVELTVPTVLVNLDVPRAQTRYLMGNPLLAAKYRFHLPAIEGRQPALVLRARWGIPINPLNTIPPTTRGAEEFSRPAHFGDPYAFLLEKTNLGLGVAAAYQVDIVYLGVQLYGDYFFPPSEVSQEDSRFPVLSWGASVGVLPMGELLGIHLEGRASSLISGPGRTEFFSNLGVRSRFLENLEAAAWASLPIGPVNRVAGIQFGVDLRVTYDIQDVIPLGSGGSRQRDGLLE